MFSYPLILSIENHCHVKQQQQMAQIMKSVFGSILLLPEFKISIGKIIIRYLLSFACLILYLLELSLFFLDEQTRQFDSRMKISIVRVLTSIMNCRGTWLFGLTCIYRDYQNDSIRFKFFKINIFFIDNMIELLPNDKVWRMMYSSHCSLTCVTYQISFTSDLSPKIRSGFPRLQNSWARW